MHSIKHVGQGVLIGAIGLMLAILALVVTVQNTPYANGMTSYFCQDDISGATTSPVYLTPGAGTTTFTLSTCVSQDGYALDSAVLNMQVNASSTPATTPVTIKYRIENSQDGINWYPRSTPINTTNINATTTMITGSYADNQWTIATTTTSGDFGGSGIASSTIGGVGGLNRVHISVPIPTDTSRIRVIFSMPAGSAKASLWAQVIGKRQFLVR